MNLHLNLTQDIGHGVIIIFLCCIPVIVVCLIDIWTCIGTSRKNKEKIRSKILRRTVAKILDYLRVVIFGVLIDVLVSASRDAGRPVSVSGYRSTLRSDREGAYERG